MSISVANNLTKAFLEPSNATHRQYEALRAYFVEGLSSAEAARRFGYTTGSFRVLCHEFRSNPQREFFLPSAKGPQAAPKVDRVRQEVVALRKQNLSIYDISRALEQEGNPLSPAAISLPMCANWTSLPESSGPVLEDYSCFCPIWPLSPSTSC
jgi:hypothetical protein